jgi:RNA 2',3'-cyclic 3'-phosphodiesterase
MTNSSASLRLFTGIPLSPGAQRSLLELCRRLHKRAPEARWIPAESMHITLFFLGNTGTERLSDVISALKEVRSASFELILDGVGGFQRAGIFFAAVTPTPELTRLAEAVTQKMMRLGFSSRESEYKPHVTLARTRHDLKKLLTTSRAEHPPRTRFSVERFLLYRSNQNNEGSHYEVIQEFPLRTA